MSFCDAFARAVKSDDVNQVESLLLDGADPNIIFSDSKTPLIYAIENVSIPMIELLAFHGALINQVDGSLHPLLVASKLKSSSKSEVICTLLKWGADPTDSGCSLAWFAQDDLLRVLDTLLANYFFTYSMLLRTQKMAALRKQTKVVDFMSRYRELAEYGEPCRLY